eukprot:1597945-Amphidinium_carterae.1
MRRLGADVADFDVVNSLDQDLANQEVFDSIVLRLTSRKFHAVVLAPPCTTFSSDGLVKLRGIAGKEIYGFPWLRGGDADAVKLGTLLALRAAFIMKKCILLHIPFVFKSRWPHPGQVHMTLLPEFNIIRDAYGSDLVWHCFDERLLVTHRVKLGSPKSATTLSKHLAACM